VAIFFGDHPGGRGGMGGGGWLGVMLGAFLGWKALLVAVLAAVLLGGVVAIVLLVLGRKGRKDPSPSAHFSPSGAHRPVLGGHPPLVSRVVA
jgi:leader peptidase (prepilin peptidase)/N-methyltransferase